jgi:hypothetical protein
MLLVAGEAIQVDSWIVDITARYDLLGLYDEKSRYQYGSYSESLRLRFFKLS